MKLVCNDKDRNTTSPVKKDSIAKFILLTLLVLLMYLPVFIWMFQRWSAPGTYYSHGFLIPAVSLFLVWLKRNRLNAGNPVHSRWGWPLFLAGILAYLASAVVVVYSLAGFSLILVLAGIIALLRGDGLLKELRFPLAFLGFMVPLPLFLTTQMSFKLKLISARLAVEAVKNMGIQAVSEGSIIKTPQAYLIVEDTCSGIRSLISLIALGALIAYFSSATRRQKLVIFISSVPIAVTSNTLRIVILTLLSEIYGPAAITGFIHTLMGTLVFAVELGGLMLVAKVLK